MTTLADIRALAERATPGPWKAEGPREWYVSAPAPNHDGMVEIAMLGNDIDGSPDDAAYIAACSPEVIKALVAVAEAAETWKATDYGSPDEFLADAGLADALDALKAVLR